MVEELVDETEACVADGIDGGRESPIASRIAAISCCCVTITSCANRLICSLPPLRSTDCAISIAP